MDSNLIVNIVFSFALLLIGLMFLEGIWHKKGKIIKSFLDVDDLFFPQLKDKRIITSGDQLAFSVCVLMAMCTLFNGLLFTVYPSIPNVSAVFIFIAIILSWPIRIIFICFYKNKKYENVPRIWPFSK